MKQTLLFFSYFESLKPSLPPLLIPKKNATRKRREVAILEKKWKEAKEPNRILQPT
jgi:hypothetical protein